MKNILVTLLILLITNAIYSQDLIVTHKGDSINCKITKIEIDNIYFTFKHKDEIRSTLLPATKVKMHKIDFYQKSVVPTEKIIGFENYQHFRIALNGGYSYQTAEVSQSIPSTIKSYINELKTGCHIGGDISYYFTETLAFGFRYYSFKTSNNMDNIFVEDIYGNKTYGKLSDDLTISFIGPIFSSRMLSQNKKNAFIMSLSLGYMGYENDKLIVDKYKMTGSTMGYSFDIGYDIGLSENLSLGFQISYISGTLYEYNWNDGKTTETINLENGEYEGLNRLDFSIGLRFCK